MPRVFRPTTLFCRAIFLFFALSVSAAQISFFFHEPATFQIGKESFKLGTPAGLARFTQSAAHVIEHNTSTSSLSKKDLRGLREMLRVTEELSNAGPNSQLALYGELFEIAAAIANNHRPPIPSYVGLPDLPFRFVDSLSNPVARGHKRASNLCDAPGVSDLSLLDPERSTFWHRPKSISSANLHAGFDRSSLPRFAQQLWSYRGPKTAGGNAGCELVSGAQHIKVKFAETHSEPFASRIFHALGYYVEATDYAPSLRIKYDRRFFQEFNSLRQMKMKIGVFFMPIHTFHMERIYDPFDFIHHAIFKDGTIHTGAELKALLLHNPKSRNLFAPENFNYSTETALDHLVTVEANIQTEDERVHSIGPWDFRGLGHEHLRELRGAGVLAAWLGWWDSRFDNTRLRIADTPCGPELRHYFSDLGAGLGLSAGTYRHSSERPHEFADTFTRSFRRHKRWRIEFPGYEPIEDTPAFEEITLDDARWMARLIGQITESQIKDALSAAGFEQEQLVRYVEKLISRRDHLIRDSQLADEIPLLRREAIAKPPER
jgi:hypothetical protein